MQYPEILPEHRKNEWTHADWFHDKLLDNVKCYFHRESSMIGMHLHGFYELNILVEGHGRHYIQHTEESNANAGHAQSFDATPGSVFVLPPNVRHGYFAMPYLNIFHALIHCAFIERYARELEALPGYATLFEIEPGLRGERAQPLFLHLEADALSRLLPEMQAMVSMESSGYPGIDTMKNGRLLWLIGALCQQVESKRDTHATANEDAYSLFIVGSMEYLRRHFPEQLSIETLAKQANMSRSTYLRHFHQVCGKTPAQYQTECRIQCAKALLRCTERSISDIAHECGFYDSSHFIRVFEQRTGASPRLYRTDGRDHCARPDFQLSSASPFPIATSHASN